MHLKSLHLKSLHLKSLPRLAALLAAVALSLTAQAVSAQTKIKFAVDWKFEGQTSFFHMAKAKGYFEREGLDVSIDTGNGSSAAIQRIASGSYDIALGDMGSLIEFMGNTPGPVRMQAVYQIYDELPLAYFTLKKNNVNSIADLAGKSVASANFEVTKKLWPVIAKAAKIAPTSVNWVTVDPSLRVNMVLKGDAVACGGFLNVPLEFTTRGIKAEDVVMLKVADIGVKGYGNAVLVSSKMIAENPKAVAAFVRATNRALLEGLADPVESVKYLKQREPLVDEALEVERFRMMMPAILTANTRSSGLGAINKMVLEQQVDDVSSAFNLKSRPNTDLIFNSSFLPPASERKFVARK